MKMDEWKWHGWPRELSMNSEECKAGTKSDEPQAEIVSFRQNRDGLLSGGEEMDCKGQTACSHG